MLIRNAEINDMPGITRCARDFFEYAKFPDMGLTLCEESFAETVKLHLSHGIVLVMVYGNEVRGGIAGLFAPWPFNKKINVVMELFFWVDPDCRGANSIKMLKIFERKSRSKGAKFISMVAVNSFMHDSVDKLYRRMGYTFFEGHYLKPLSGRC